MVSRHNDLVRVRLGIKPGYLALELGESAVLGEVAGVDKDVARWEDGLRGVGVGEADDPQGVGWGRVWEGRRRGRLVRVEMGYEQGEGAGEEALKWRGLYWAEDVRGREEVCGGCGWHCCVGYEELFLFCVSFVGDFVS